MKHNSIWSSSIWEALLRNTCRVREREMKWDKVAVNYMVGVSYKLWAI